MSDIGNILNEAMMQYVAGTAIGSAIDSVMPSVASPAQDSKDIAMTALEMAAQVGISVLVAVKAAELIGIAGPTDPTAGFAYSFSLFASQPTLSTRAQRVGRYVRTQVRSLTRLLQADEHSDAVSAANGEPIVIETNT